MIATSEWQAGNAGYVVVNPPKILLQCQREEKIGSLKEALTGTARRKLRLYIKISQLLQIELIPDLSLIALIQTHNINVFIQNIVVLLDSSGG